MGAVVARVHDRDRAPWYKSTVRVVSLLLVIAAAGCGRSSQLPIDCLLSFAPAHLDFAPTHAGMSLEQALTLGNLGQNFCDVGPIRIGDDGGGVFSVAPPATLSFAPGDAPAVAVTFAPKDASLPLHRTGTLVFGSNDLKQAEVSIPLSADIISDCKVEVMPSAVDFGLVALGLTVTRNVTVVDRGIGPCELSGVALAKGSDSEFSVATTPTTIVLQPGAATMLAVSFSAVDKKPPHHRTGTLVFASTDPGQPMLMVPLSADIDVGCDLTITPPSLDFGNVILNTIVSAPVTLGNDGTRDCTVSEIHLGPDTDPLFSLAPNTPGGFVVPVNGSQAITVRFSASDSQPPHLRTGSLRFLTGMPSMPDGLVPLSAYINTICVEASRWIYTVDDTGRFSRFDPQTLTFFDIGVLSCPTGSSPNSMAVDQNAIAWVQYLDGNLFRVDTGNASCSATSYAPNQDGITDFGMGFVFDPMTGQDTLYVAGAANTTSTTSTLATISFPQLVLSPIGPVAGFPELSGLGDGTLWGFIPSFVSPSGMTELIRIDPATGNTLETHTYSSLTQMPSSWAMKFWGGSFWLFLGDTIYQVNRNTPDTITVAASNTGRNIVGAGVSTCAPLQ
jgi:hypothetical protein